MIDWNIRIGDMAVMASLIGAIVVFSYKTGSFTRSVEVMQKELEGLKEIAKTISQVLTTVAVQKSEIEHIREDINDLKRGRGYIQGEHGINGEYPRK